MLDMIVVADKYDYYITDPMKDSISMLKFYPVKEKQILASCGWDSKVYIWNIKSTSSLPSKTNVQHSLIYGELFENPLLSLCWQGKNPNIFTGSTDGSIYMIDIQNKAKHFLGKHELGCKDVIYNEEMNVLISGGWDGKINVWDFRSNHPIISSYVGGKIYSMSSSNQMLVVAFNDRNISLFNLKKLRTSGQLISELTCKSDLKYQTRKVCCFPKGDGYVIGSIEGKFSMKYFSFNKVFVIDKNTGSTNNDRDYILKCHRNERIISDISEIFSINDIAFNPVYGTFATVGSDGSYYLWDKESKRRLKQGKLETKSPITACDFSFDGNLFAYSEGYDWSKGINGNANVKPRIGIKILTDNEKKSVSPFAK